MKAIIESLNAMAEMLFNIGEFIINLVKNSAKAMQTITIVSTESMELVNNLPDFIQVFASITILISVLYLLLGWNAGRSE